MKTFRFIGMALLAIVMCVNFASCSSDNDEESNGGKSTQELLQGVWYDAYTDDCPYFIVEKGYCYCPHYFFHTFFPPNWLTHIINSSKTVVLIS